MWLHNLNPTLLSFGPLEVRWYGIVYVLGIFFTVWWVNRYKSKFGIELSKEAVWDLVFYLVLGMLIGARLFETFWDPARYLSNPLNYLKIWQGGMSFHGAFVGIVVTAWFYCKKKKINFWNVADILSAPTMLVLAIGRVANFINGELIGKVFNGAWCVNFKNTGGGDVCRHPYVMYEAGKRLMVFLGLLWLSFKDNFKPGFIFWNFIFWENLGRFALDFYKEDFTYYWIFTPGQWLSVAMIVVAGVFFYRNHKEDWKRLLKN